MDGEYLYENFLGDLELLSSLVELFRDEMGKQIADIKAAIEMGDPKKIEMIAHAAKGGAQGVGAKSLAKYLAELELNAAKLDIERFLELHRLSADAVIEYNLEISKYLKFVETSG